MKYTESEFYKTFNIRLDTPRNIELFLKANAKGAYDLSLISMFMNDPSEENMAKLRTAKLWG
jgi:hypothetical protein